MAQPSWPTSNDLNDASTAAPNDNDVMQFNSVSGFWEPTQLTAFLKMDDLTDADTATSPPNAGDHLEWDGSNWVPAAIPAGTFSPDFGLINSTAGATATTTLTTVNTWYKVVVNAPLFDPTSSSGVLEGTAFALKNNGVTNATWSVECVLTGDAQNGQLHEFEFRVGGVGKAKSRYSIKGQGSKEVTITMHMIETIAADLQDIEVWVRNTIEGGHVWETYTAQLMVHRVK